MKTYEKRGEKLIEIETFESVETEYNLPALLEEKATLEEGVAEINGRLKKVNDRIAKAKELGL